MQKSVESVDSEGRRALAVKPRAALAAVLALLAAACSEPEPPPQAREPAAALSADRDQLAALLQALGRLEGTPLGRRASELRAALPDCPLLEAAAREPHLEALRAALRCRREGSPLDPLHASRGNGGLAFVWPLEESPPLRGTLTVRADGGVDTTLTLPRDAASGLAALLVPGARAAGPGLLSADETLLHARLRPAGGLDVASLVPAGGQGDRMFRLKSALFRGLVLDGTWEAAVYLPGPGEPAPRAALALGFAQRDAAAAAFDGFLSELETTWSVRRSFFAVGEAEGACLLELRLLPGFAPCAVLTERAVVVGYNPPSVRRALDGEGSAVLGAAGAAVVELGRFAEADVRLARAAGMEPAARARSPWRHIVAEGREDEDALRLELAFEPRPRGSRGGT